MCGIVGIVNLKGEINLELLHRMSEAIQHRGPDDCGIECLHSNAMSVGFASRRLSIIDLTNAGHMPMCNTDKNIWITYNGEIYNHLQIRQMLSEYGIRRFRSRTDTETLLYTYQVLGLDAFKLFDGIFAVAIYDQRTDEVILARDRMGVKPLYYAWDGQELIFASELKALLLSQTIKRRINPEALQLYLAYGYVPSPYTLITGINKLEPGNTLTLHCGHLEKIPYWQPTLDLCANEQMTDEQLAENVETIIEQAVKAQLMSDVPVGVLLSGGLDSTIITALAQKNLPDRMHTFSVGFQVCQSELEDIYNHDFDTARQVSMGLGTIHHEVIIKDDNQLPEKIDRLVNALDEPLWEPSYLSIYAMSEMARQFGIKVLLTGDGADELFGGYPWYWGALNLERYERIPSLNLLLPIAERILPAGLLHTKVNDLRLKYQQPKPVQYLINYQHFSRELSSRFINQNALIPSSLPVDYITSTLQPVQTDPVADQFGFADTLLWVREHFNLRVDRMTMLASIEGRVPYQANPVVDCAFSIPMRRKITSHKRKIQLQTAFGRYLPDYVLNRPKRPFAAPVKAWLFGALRSYTLDCLNTSGLNGSGLLNSSNVQAFVETYLKDPVSARNDQFTFIQIFNLLSLSVWASAYHVES